MIKDLDFQSYIINNKISSALEVKDLLLNNSFKLIDIYDGGNNYHKFVDSNGILKFNNPKLSVDLQNFTLSFGVITPESTGNNLRLNNIFLFENDITKSSIISEIEQINRDVLNSLERKRKLDDYMRYLVIINSEKLIEEDYKDFTKKELEESLKKTSIAKLKN